MCIFAIRRCPRRARTIVVSGWFASWNRGRGVSVSAGSVVVQHCVRLLGILLPGMMAVVASVAVLREIISEIVVVFVQPLHYQHNLIDNLFILNVANV